MSIYRPVAPEFFQQARYFEGPLWASFLCLDGFFLKKAIEQRAEKPIDLISSACSTASSGAVLLNWLGRIQWLHLGSAWPFVSAVAYMGRGISSSFPIWEGIKELLGTAKALLFASSDHQKLLCRQLEALFKIAFYITSCAWGIFGTLASLYGGAALFQTVDALFRYSCFLFIGYFFTFFYNYEQKKSAAPA